MIFQTNIQKNWIKLSINKITDKPNFWKIEKSKNYENDRTTNKPNFWKIWEFEKYENDKITDELILKKFWNSKIWNSLISQFPYQN